MASWPFSDPAHPVSDDNRPSVRTTAVVTEATGLYAGLEGVPAVYSDFRFRPLVPNPVDPLWTVGPFSFSLHHVLVRQRGTDFIALRGFGEVTGPGVGSRRGRWEFTAEDDGRFTARMLPEPVTQVLLAAGLLGAGFLARRAGASRTGR